MSEEALSKTGKDPKTGYFLPGNKVAKGNAVAHKMTALRNAVLNAVKEGDVVDVLNAMIKKGREGDVKAAQLVFEVTGVRVKHIEATIEDGTQKAFLSVEVERV